MRAHEVSVSKTRSASGKQAGPRLLRQDSGHSKRLLSVLFLLLSFTAGALFLTQQKAEAVSGAVLNYKKSTIVSVESSCQADLAAQRKIGGSARTQVNKSDPYREIYWITPSGNAASDITATAGSTTAIPLQLNAMDFICAILTKTNYNRTTALASTIVTNADFPNDRGPNPDSSSPLAATIDAASRYELRTYIVSAAITSGPGSLSGVDPGLVIKTSRSSTSRYWDSDRTEPFNYVPPAGGLPSGTTQITIKYQVKRAYVYHNYYGGSGVDTTCTKPGTNVSIDPGESSINWSKCATTTASVTFNITARNPKLSVTSTPAASCTAIKGSAVDGDSPNTQVRIDIYEGGTATVNRQFTTHTSGSGHTFSVNLSDVLKGNTQAGGGYNPYPSPATGTPSVGGPNAHPGASTDWAQQTFYVYAYGVDSTGHEATPNSSTQLKIGPCASLSCSTTNFALGTIGQPINFSVNMKLNSTVGTLPPGNQTFSVTVTGSGPGTNNQSYSNVPDNPPGGLGGKIASDSMTFTPAAPGTYTVTWSYYGKSGCNGKDDVAYTPYFAVNGGDITAGAGFGGACTNNDSADIESWNTNSGAYTGAGSQLGAIASGNITNFVSGLGLTGGAASYNGYGLSFANQANIGGAGNYGGQFGTSAMPCLTDVYGAADGTAIGNSFSAGDIPGAAGTYSFNANSAKAVNFTFTLGSGASGGTTTIPAGDTISIYVSGDVYIKNNIVYAPYSLTNVPRLNLYVSGSIFIDPKVTTLHGVYVAQKTDSDTGGDVDTCAASTTAVIQPYVACANPLTVVGALEAEDQLALTRTYGNILAVPAAGIPAAPAEVFQYSPELWLNVPAGANQFDVKSYTSLPPVL